MARSMVESTSSRQRHRALRVWTGSRLVPIVIATALLFAGGVVSTIVSQGSSSVRHLMVVATAETEPVPNAGDAADDAAIWVNPVDGDASTVIGTDKNGGLAVYDLNGRELQYLPDGEMNNVDLRDGVSLGGESVTVVTASDRSDNTIAVYRIDSTTGLLSDVAVRDIVVDMDVYGLCMYRGASGAIYTFVNSKDGTVEQWELFDDGAGRVDADMVRSFDVGSQVEGCVADDGLGRLYVGEEDVGIWEFAAEPDSDTEGSLIAEADSAGPLVADVEGLAIAYGPDGTGWMLVSSQGNSTLAVYERTSPHNLVLTFSVGDGPDTDGVSDTDGIDVTTAPLGTTFPSGLFVVQDGDNGEDNQNFKLVDWNLIARELPEAEVESE